MAIIVSTGDPTGLLAAIKAQIDSGTIETWKYDTQGDFSHTPPQWLYKAWLRPSTEAGALVFRILTPKDTNMSRVIYAVYHGRFIEMLLTHFDVRFSVAEATALPSRGDIVKA